MKNIVNSVGNLCQKVRELSLVQQKTRKQLTLLAAVSGRLRKLALAKNNKRVAAMAALTAFRAGRLAKRMRSNQNVPAGTVQNVGKGMMGFAGVGVRSENVGLAGATRSTNVAIKKPAPGSGRPKGPVKLVDTASFAGVTAKLRAAQEEFRALKARRGFPG